MEVTTKTLLQDGDINKNQEELIFDPYNSRNREIIHNHKFQRYLKNMEYLLQYIILSYMLEPLFIDLM